MAATRTNLILLHSANYRPLSVRYWVNR